MSSGVEAYRTFIAIELPRELRGRIGKHIHALRHDLPEVRASWTREENLHLTLKFLGDVPLADIPKLSAAIENVTRAATPFQLVVSDCGSFPARRQPRVLWIGVSEPPAPEKGQVTDRQNSYLGFLRDAIERECEKAGFPREGRAFHPHLTIARLRSAKGASRLAHLHAQRGFNPTTVEVREVLVMRSELSSAGSRYTLLARHALVGPQK